jgi:hypothetical protein
MHRGRARRRGRFQISEFGIGRSERPLRRQSLPQLFDLGNGSPDLRLPQVLAQLGRKSDQLLVHAHNPASEYLGGGEQKARGPRVAVSQGFVKGARRDSPQMAFGAGNCGRGSWGVKQWTHLAEDRTRPERSQCAVVLRGRAQLDQDLAAKQQVDRIPRVTLSEQDLAGWKAHFFQVDRERGNLLGVERLEATEAVNQSGIDDVLHRWFRYTPRNMAALATRPSATMYAAVRQSSFRDCTRPRIVA